MKIHWDYIVETDKLVSILNIVYKNTKSYPSRNVVLNNFKSCNYSDLKIVFLRFSPIYNLLDHNGIGMAQNPEAPEGLNKELELFEHAVVDYSLPHGYQNINFDYSLKEISKQGVLFLNVVPTMTDKYNHKILWFDVIKNLLITLSENCSGIIYVLTDPVLQEYEKFINCNHNYVVKINFPYYIKNKINIPKEKFKYIDDVCIKLYGEPIKWFTYY